MLCLKNIMFCQKERIVLGGICPEKNPACHVDGNDARPDEDTREVYMVTGASVEEFSQVFVLLCFCIIVMLSVIALAVFWYG